ncbi:hypothetical protein GFD21_08460 [Bifidobacterium sp. SMA15]|uniref:DUF4190 domain-containing protein n=1 Tax=Bifidobacterium platyrrhinorum TaxID=2661628 RepID=A0A6L9ST35_9BIFI|nr:hypothetical protein [Bifidobacterium platyrrhinorum]
MLGFFIPIVGLILFLVWKDSRPNDAKKAGMGALVSVIIGIVLWVLMFILGFAIVGSATSSYSFGLLL